MFTQTANATMSSHGAERSIDRSAMTAGRPSSTSPEKGPARLTAMRLQRVGRPEDGMVTPPMVWSTIREPTPQTRKAAAWPSSWTRIDPVTTTTQATIRVSSPNVAPIRTVNTRKVHSRRTGTPARRSWSPGASWWWVSMPTGQTV